MLLKSGVSKMYLYMVISVTYNYLTDMGVYR